MDKAEKAAASPLFTALILLGVIARILLPVLGYNHDFISYEIVSNIVIGGGNVYAETERYNYGPIWFLVLGAVREIAMLTPHPEIAFRFGLVGILTAADLAIASMLNRRFGPKAASVFFLNPVSIFITGYHNQFDNVAIALGLAALLVAERADPEAGGRRRLAALGLLGLSLMVKHLFFVFPLWLAFRARRWRDALVALALPVALFVAGFLPFLATGWRGILHNVLLYRSFNNGLLYHWPSSGLEGTVPPTIPFIAILVLAGWLIRKRSLVESGLVYLVVLVVFSPAMANQYLAIPAAAVAVAMNPFYAAYILAASLVLLSNPDGLGLALFPKLLGPGGDWLDGRFGYDLPTLLLGAGLVWQVVSWRRSRNAEMPAEQA